MKVKRYDAPEGVPLPFFARDMEPCEIVRGFFKDLNSEPTPEEHIAAWQHVKVCFTCLRNIARVAFRMGDGGMPLPIYLTPDERAERARELNVPVPTEARAN